MERFQDQYSGGKSRTQSRESGGARGVGGVVPFPDFLEDKAIAAAKAVSAAHGPKKQNREDVFFSEGPGTRPETGQSAAVLTLEFAFHEGESSATADEKLYWYDSRRFKRGLFPASKQETPHGRVWRYPAVRHRVALVIAGARVLRCPVLLLF